MHRESEETWREAVARQGRKYGVEAEVLATFDALDTMERDQAFVAWDACNKHNALDRAAAPKGIGHDG